MTDNSAVAMLYRAADLIEQRSAERDKPDGERTMADCVHAFWIIFGKNILARGHITETEGWEFMSILKKVRSAGGGYKPDDYEDDVAYAALAAESEARWRKTLDGAVQRCVEDAMSQDEIDVFVDEQFSVVTDGTPADFEAFWEAAP